MTINEATVKVIDFLEKTKKPYIVVDDDFLNIVTISGDDSDKPAVILALKDMEQNNVVKSLFFGEKQYYILTSGLDSFTQNIDLSPSTCNEVSKVIAKFCNVIDDYKDECDPTNLTEKDIFNLTVICNFFFDSASPSQGGEKGE